MVLVNYTTRELTAKLVYYGPGLCGKTTNLQYVFDNLLPKDRRGKMVSLATETDRTLFFDFLPLEIGTIRGLKTRLQLYTVPGQVHYNATRKIVLKGADGIVFVADSQATAREGNLEAYKNMKANLAEHGLDLANVPHVFQFNKRDLPNVMPVEEMEGDLNEHNVPFWEATAIQGIGVEDTLKSITKLVLKSLATRFQSDGREGEAAAAPAAAAAGGGAVAHADPPPPLPAALEAAPSLAATAVPSSPQPVPAASWPTPFAPPPSAPLELELEPQSAGDEGDDVLEVSDDAIVLEDEDAFAQQASPVAPLPQAPAVSASEPAGSPFGDPYGASAFGTPAPDLESALFDGGAPFAPAAPPPPASQPAPSARPEPVASPFAAPPRLPSIDLESALLSGPSTADAEEDIGSPEEEAALMRGDTLLSPDFVAAVEAPRPMETSQDLEDAFQSGDTLLSGAGFGSEEPVAFEPLESPGAAPAAPHAWSTVAQVAASDAETARRAEDHLPLAGGEDLESALLMGLPEPVAGAPAKPVAPLAAATPLVAAPAAPDAIEAPTIALGRAQPGQVVQRTLRVPIEYADASGPRRRVLEVELRFRLDD